MAADIFESYEVTIVAAMILGIASFGHKGVIFPLARAGDRRDRQHHQHLQRPRRRQGLGWRGHEERQSRLHDRLGASACVGFIVLGLFYLHFDADLPRINIRRRQAGFPMVNGGAASPAGTCQYWANFGVAGLDMRAAWTCLIGIILAVLLNKCTEYYTGTEFEPVKSLARNCSTGHATNIIQGFAIGYESTRGGRR